MKQREKRAITLLGSRVQEWLTSVLPPDFPMTPKQSNRIRNTRCIRFSQGWHEEQQQQQQSQGTRTCIAACYSFLLVMQCNTSSQTPTTRVCSSHNTVIIHCQACLIYLNLILYYFHLTYCFSSSSGLEQPPHERLLLSDLGIIIQSNVHTVHAYYIQVPKWKAMDGALHSQCKAKMHHWLD